MFGKSAIKKKNVGFEDSDLFVSINADDKSSLHTISWASMIEEELGDSIEDKELTHNTKTNTNTLFSNTPSVVDFENILKIKYQTMNDVNIMQYQSFIAGELRKTIKTTNEIVNIIDRVRWLRKISEYLAKKIGMVDKLNKDVNVVDNIPRSSYNFCQHSYECKYNYNSHFDGCYSQHYVHNLVAEDLLMLENHILGGKINVPEVKKCVNTISYVVSHMYEELRHIEFFNRGKSDAMHKEKNSTYPREKRNKKNKKKKKPRKHALPHIIRT
jgi:hypothetical protein